MSQEGKSDEDIATEVCNDLMCVDYDMTSAEIIKAREEIILEALSSKSTQIYELTQKLFEETAAYDGARLEIEELKGDVEREKTLNDKNFKAWTENVIETGKLKECLGKCVEALRFCGSCECHLPGFKNNNERCDVCKALTTAQRLMGEGHSQTKGELK